MTYVVLLYNAIEERSLVAATPAVPLDAGGEKRKVSHRGRGSSECTPLPLPDRSEDDSALLPEELAMIRKCNQKMEALKAKLQHSPRSHVPTADGGAGDALVHGGAQCSAGVGRTQPGKGCQPNS